MPFRLSKYIPEQAALKGLWWSLFFENLKDVFLYRYIKTRVLLFQKTFYTKLKKQMRGLVKSITKALCNLQV